MRAIHLILTASLAANVLVAIGYFYTRGELERHEVSVAGNTVLRDLALTPEQTSQLREMRRRARADLQGLRNEWRPLFDDALQKMRDARPGDTSYESAFLATGEVRRRQTLVMARALIAFREHLTPVQREAFNRHLGEWSFIEAVIGLPGDRTSTPPSGPFQSTPPAPNKTAP
jgi:hypothetical protein